MKVILILFTGTKISLIMSKQTPKPKVAGYRFSFNIPNYSSDRRLIDHTLSKSLSMQML